MDEFERLHSRFDKLENKLDSHLERLSKAEEAITWIRGHINFVTSIGLALVAAVLAFFFKT